MLTFSPAGETSNGTDAARSPAPKLQLPPRTPRSEPAEAADSVIDALRRTRLRGRRVAVRRDGKA